MRVSYPIKKVIEALQSLKFACGFPINDAVFFVACDCEKQAEEGLCWPMALQVEKGMLWVENLLVSSPVHKSLFIAVCPDSIASLPRSGC